MGAASRASSDSHSVHASRRHASLAPGRSEGNQATPRALATVPPELVHHLVRFLLGGEILRLSHCDSALYHLLSVDSVWRHRLLNASSQSIQTKKLYCQSRSLLFHDTQDAVQLPLALFPKRHDLSFDVWFAMRPCHRRRKQGVRVLIGAQDVRLNGSVREPPDQHRAFAFIDSNHELHCSVLEDKPAVASALVPSRWYHLALTYDHARQCQRVYLDGQLVHHAAGTTQWPWLQFAQLGVGYVATASHSRDHQWCSFTGLIDEMRVCYLPWTEEQVRRLAMGKRIHAPMAYALTRARSTHIKTGHSTPGDGRALWCARPVETYVDLGEYFARTQRQTRAKTRPRSRSKPAAAAPKPNRSLWDLFTQCL